MHGRGERRVRSRKRLRNPSTRRRGNRQAPGRVTEPSAPLVRSAVEATRALGEEPVLISSSTDANLPMSLGIPSITMGAGGRGGGIHTLEEWFENEKGPEGILRALLTVLLLDPDASLD